MKTLKILNFEQVFLWEQKSSFLLLLRSSLGLGGGMIYIQSGGREHAIREHPSMKYAIGNYANREHATGEHGKKWGTFWVNLERKQVGAKWGLAFQPNYKIKQQEKEEKEGGKKIKRGEKGNKKNKKNKKKKERKKTKGGGGGKGKRRGPKKKKKERVLFPTNFAVFSGKKNWEFFFFLV